ncbi:hypothetical protein ACFQH8_09075 [Halomicroarcula sp. GCM10025710]
MTGDGERDSEEAAPDADDEQSAGGFTIDESSTTRPGRNSRSWRCPNPARRTSIWRTR